MHPYFSYVSNYSELFSQGRNSQVMWQPRAGDKKRSLHNRDSKLLFYDENRRNRNTGAFFRHGCSKMQAQHDDAFVSWRYVRKETIHFELHVSTNWLSPLKEMCEHDNASPWKFLMNETFRSSSILLFSLQAAVSIGSFIEIPTDFEASNRISVFLFGVVSTWRCHAKNKSSFLMIDWFL